MCFPPVRKSKGRRGSAEAYRIHRLDYSEDGYHDRRHSSVRRHLATAPIPNPKMKKNNKRYPKRYENRDELYDTETPLYEYPTKEYPWDHQNQRGKANIPSPNGRHYTTVEPEYTRTITDGQKNIRGVNYHPYQKPKEFLRAEEIYPSRGRSRR